MKIAGKVPGINRAVIEFHRPGGNIFRLIVSAVPYGFAERIEREIPLPEPPVEFAKDPKSGAVLRDEFGMALKTEKRSDPAFQSELGRVRALRVVAHAHEALKGDPNVKFAADSGPERNGRRYVELIEQEFADAGFADSEIIAIFSKSLELNRGSAQKLDEASESFLLGNPSASDGASQKTPGDLAST